MFNAYRLAEPLGYWNAFGLHGGDRRSMLGRRLRRARAQRPGRLFVARRRAARPRRRAVLAFSRGSWLRSVLRSGRGGRRSTRGAYAALVVSSSSPRRRRVGVAYRVASGGVHDRATSPAAAAAREGPSARLAARGARRSCRRCSVGSRIASAAPFPRRRAFGAAHAVALAGGGRGCGRAARSLAGGGAERVLAELRDGSRPAPRSGLDLNDRLFSISGNGGARRSRSPGTAAVRRPVVGTGAGTFEILWYERRPSTSSWCATRTRCTSRRSASSGSSA